MLDGLDWDSAPELTTRAELDAEVARLRSRLSHYIVAEPLPGSQREVLDLRGPWFYMALPSGDIADPSAIADSQMTNVTLPDYRSADHSWYRRYFRAEPGHRRAWLCFDAVDYEADVWFNGSRLGRHRGYFGPFRFDVTELMSSTRQQVDVRVRRASDDYAWDGKARLTNKGDAHGKGLGSVVDGKVAAGSGIIGNVRLEFAADLTIEDVFVRGDPQSGTVEVTGRVANLGPANEGLTLVASVRPRTAEGGGGEGRTRLRVAAGESRSFRLAVDVAEIEPWTLDRPALYWLDLTLLDHGRAIDHQLVSFGFRTVERADDGTILLNGRPCFLRGTTTLGCLWEAAVRGNEDAIIDQLLRVKAAFANTLRVSVHVLPDIVYDCADRIGLLIYQDSAFHWNCFVPVEEHLDEEVLQFIDLIRLMRNHPSVIACSLGNEMHMQEPFHPADARFFALATQAIADVDHGLMIVQDHHGKDRPAWPPTSFHAYPGYFGETARWAGPLVDMYDTARAIGDTPRTSTPAERVVLSEYGAGSMPSWPAIRELQRAYEMDRPGGLLLPDRPTDPWPVEQLAGHALDGTIRKTQRVVGRRSSWADYRRATDLQQASVLSFLTYRLRRERSTFSGAIQHFLANPSAWLYNPWVDLVIIDHLGEPTGGYFALREAFRPLALDLAVPARRAWPGQPIDIAIWLFNDFLVRQAVDIEWSVVDDDGQQVVAAGNRRMSADPDSAVLAVSETVMVPETCRPGATLTLTAELRIDGRLWCRRARTVTVWRRLALTDVSVEIIGDVEDAMTELKPFGLRVIPYQADGPMETPVLVLPRVAIAPETQMELRRRMVSGGRVVLLERPPGEHLGWVTGGNSLLVSDMAPCDLVQPEQPLSGSDLDIEAMSDWNTDDGRVVEAPLLAETGFRRGHRWASCGYALQLSALHEADIGHGGALICQAVVWRALGREPAAWSLLRLMLVARSGRATASTE